DRGAERGGSGGAAPPHLSRHRRKRAAVPRAWAGAPARRACREPARGCERARRAALLSPDGRGRLRHGGPRTADGGDGRLRGGGDRADRGPPRRGLGLFERGEHPGLRDVRAAGAVHRCGAAPSADPLCAAAPAGVGGAARADHRGAAGPDLSRTADPGPRRVAGGPKGGGGAALASRRARRGPDGVGGGAGILGARSL
ncbi:MAG: Carboxylesterase, partial [uncultured Rubellimicrobium sp.]